MPRHDDGETPPPPRGVTRDRADYWQGMAPARLGPGYIDNAAIRGPLVVGLGPILWYRHYVLSDRTNLKSEGDHRYSRSYDGSREHDAVIHGPHEARLWCLRLRRLPAVA